MHSKINKHAKPHLFDFLKFKFLIFGGSDAIIPVITMAVKVQGDSFLILSIDYCVAH